MHKYLFISILAVSSLVWAKNSIPCEKQINAHLEGQKLPTLDKGNYFFTELAGKKELTYSEFTSPTTNLRKYNNSVDELSKLYKKQSTLLAKAFKINFNVVPTETYDRLLNKCSQVCDKKTIGAIKTRRDQMSAKIKKQTKEEKQMQKDLDLIQSKIDQIKDSLGSQMVFSITDGSEEKKTERSDTHELYFLLKQQGLTHSDIYKKVEKEFMEDLGPTPSTHIEFSPGMNTIAIFTPTKGPDVKILNMTFCEPPAFLKGSYYYGLPSYPSSGGGDSSPPTNMRVSH